MTNIRIQPETYETYDATILVIINVSNLSQGMCSTLTTSKVTSNKTLHYGETFNSGLQNLCTFSKYGIWFLLQFRTSNVCSWRCDFVLSNHIPRNMSRAPANNIEVAHKGYIYFTLESTPPLMMDPIWCIPCCPITFAVSGIVAVPSHVLVHYSLWLRKNSVGSLKLKTPH